MADTASSPSGGDHGSKEEQLSMSQRVGDVEMEDLSQTQPKPANPDTATSHDADPRPLPVPDKDQQPTSEASSKAQGKAPAKSADPDLAIAPVESEAGPSGSDGELVVDILLMLMSGAKHPFRIDEKYLTKRNVAVTGKTEDGKLDPFSITVYTLKELVLRDWRKEWDQPPREPSAIRLIHFGKMLEDRNQLSFYRFSKEGKNVVHMTVKPQDLVEEEEAAKRVKDSGSHRGRGGCCIIL
ncbi:hypothetical protein F4778DRAFT_616147 [Xylariomycetidae sp. FL2044]|nr:hypothetical protein F4778DRAFT_616147 [Xylariomycetidae sp. FL2044]